MDSVFTFGIVCAARTLMEMVAVARVGFRRPFARHPACPNLLASFRPPDFVDHSVAGSRALASNAGQKPGSFLATDIFGIFRSPRHLLSPPFHGYCGPYTSLRDVLRPSTQASVASPL